MILMMPDPVSYFKHRSPVKFSPY